MIWQSDIADAKEFTRALASRPHFVAVRGHQLGRYVTSCVPSVISEDAEMIVFGPDKKWRIHIKRDGRSFKLQKMRLQRTLAKKKR